MTIKPAVNQSDRHRPSTESARGTRARRRLVEPRWDDGPDHPFSDVPDPVYPLRLEPLPALEWSTATTPTGAWDRAQDPAEARTAWVHTAPEDQVLALYRASKAEDPGIEAPWWLEPLADGRLPSRDAAFFVEDRAAKLLAARVGWVFTPWGEDGCWEYLPSEQWALHPTRLVCTNRHEQWMDVYPAHDDDTEVSPVAVRGIAGLRADLGRIEKL